MPEIAPGTSLTMEYLALTVEYLADGWDIPWPPASRPPSARRKRAAPWPGPSGRGPTNPAGRVRQGGRPRPPRARGRPSGRRVSRSPALSGDDATFWPSTAPSFQANDAEVRRLLGSSPGLASHSGVAPLRRAVRTRGVAPVLALIESGADPSLSNKRRSTPLHHGARPADVDASGEPVSAGAPIRGVRGRPRRRSRGGSR